MARNKVTSKYTDVQQAFVRLHWDKGVSAQDIAALVNAKFDLVCTRNAIISLARRLNLDARHTGGAWQVSGAQKRAETILASGGYTGPKKKTPPPEPPDAPLTAIGPIDEMVGDNACKFPVSATGAPFQQCGHLPVPGRPYCLPHCRITYTPTHKPLTESSRSARQFR